MYDIIFLGGGPAGYEGAIAAGKKGMKVAVVELYKLGGTCLQWGCVPTKALLHTAKLIKELQSSAKIGVSVDSVNIDVATIRKTKERVVNKLTKGIELLFKQNNVEIINGKGKVVAPHTVMVDEKIELKGKHIVIATGSKPAELPFLKVDDKYIINSDKALGLDPIPEKMLVIGAGAIGVEMGVIYRYLGTQVTVVEILDHIVPGSDVELSEILKKELQKQKIKVHTATRVSSPTINEEEGTISFTFTQGDKEWQESFNMALLSVGRLPLSQGVVDESLAVKVDKRGFIEVDENLLTGEPGIFACGDVIGQPLLAHKASHQAIAIVDYLSEGKEIVHHPIPGAVFTFPELASIGITEEEIKETGTPYKVGKFPYSAGSRSNAIDAKVGMVKIIAAEDNTILGAHIVGAEAGELMPLLNMAVTKAMKADEFKELIMIHPTLAENTWEAIGQVAGFSIHI